MPEIKFPPKIETISVTRLVVDANNARTHSDEQVAELAGSIAAFGFNDPIAVDPDLVIIEGHGRRLAAISLGLAEVPIIRLPHLDEAGRQAYALAHNRIAEHAGWDNALLAESLLALKDQMGVDPATLGFAPSDLAGILAAASSEAARARGADPDETPEPQPIAVSRPGDIWLLGNHRLVCGDSTDAATVKLLLGGIRPNLMVTDPPYGVEYDANWRNERARTSAGMGNRALGAGAVGKVMNDDRAQWADAFDLFPGDVAYVWHAGLRARQAIEGLEQAGFQLRAQIIWAKNQLVIGRGDYHFKHEPCFYAVRKGKKGSWAGDRKQTTLWEIPKPQASETGHSTQKPVECMRRPIINNSKPGDSVYEPFSGSGTTIIAAQMTGRRCFAIELDPVYVDMAVRRWERYADQKALLESDGRPFAEVEAARTRSKSAKSSRPKLPKATPSQKKAKPRTRSKAEKVKA